MNGVAAISGRSFCFTGHVESGTRKEVEAEPEKCGGELAESVTKALDCLVIGGDPIRPGHMRLTRERSRRS